MKKKLWINHGLLALALGAPLLAVISCGDNATYTPPADTGPKTEAELWDEKANISLNEIDAEPSKYYETLPDGTIRVKEDAFRSRKLPSGFKLPQNTTVIGKYSFASTKPYKTFALPEGIVTIEDSAFGASELPQGFLLPRSVRRIEFNAFGAISNLPTTFRLPNPVWMENKVFSGTTLFESFSVPMKLPEFPDEMYQLGGGGLGFFLKVFCHPTWLGLIRTAF